MSNQIVLVIDAGTSMLRCHAFYLSGDMIASFSAPWAFLDEPDAPDLARSFDARKAWQSCCDVIQQALRASCESASSITGISITSQRQAVVFLDNQGREIYVGPNTDLRAVFEGGEIDESFGAEVYTTTGHLPSMLFAPAKLKWFRNHRPGEFDRIASVLPLANWLAWKLTGEFTIEPMLSCEAGLLDVTDRVVARRLITNIGVASAVPGLPDDDIARKDGEACQWIGTVTSSASEESRIASGTPVIVAGPDTQVGLLGLGANSHGDIGIVAGWSEAIQMLTDRPFFSPQGRTWTGCYFNGKWVAESSPGDVGNSYSRIAELMSPTNSVDFVEMDALASQVPPGSDGVRSLLGPARMNASSVGMTTGGITFPTPVTFSEMTRGSLVRAMLESFAYVTRANVEQLQDLAGEKTARIALGGGMTRTRSFAPIVAAVLGRDIAVSPVPQVTALGAFLCAGIASGQFASTGEAAEFAIDRLQTVTPDPYQVAEYQGLYEDWLALADGLGGIKL